MSAANCTATMGSVHFAAHIAPLGAANCANCGVGTGSTLAWNPLRLPACCGRCLDRRGVVSLPKAHWGNESVSSTRRVLLLLCLLIAGPSLAQVDEYALKRLPEPAARAPFVPADTASFSGSNAAGAEWARPFADGACCSGLGPVRWVAQQFFISANDTCNVRSVQAGGWDGYLFVYRSPFNAATPTANLVAGDDDGAGASARPTSMAWH